MTLGPQFTDAFGPDPVRSKAIGIINQAVERGEPVLNEEDTRKVMGAVNIRQWPLSDAPSFIRPPAGGAGENMGNRYYDETLHTSQTHLYAPAVQKYMAGDVPEFDEDYVDDSGVSDVQYLPEIGSTERGTPFIQEGHHRLVAARLRGEDSDTWEYPLRKYT